ncbi:hypothetical protein J7L67_05420 [bacterium]|nr:hypothetical protein [bacterium]
MNEKFGWSDLWTKGKELVTAAEDFLDLDGSTKKEFVVNTLVELQMTYLNTPIPDVWERKLSRIAIGWMVESIVKLLTDKGIINVGKDKAFVSAPV